MGDYKTRLLLDDADFAPKAKAAEQQLAALNKQAEEQNARDRRAAAVRKELARTAQEQRKEAESRKPVEEQINNALERRERLTRLIARAGDNQYRKDVLTLQLRETNKQLEELKKSSDQSLSGFLLKLPGVSTGLSGLETVLAKLAGRFGGLSFIGGAAVGLGGLVASKARESQSLVAQANAVGLSTSRTQAFDFAASATGTDSGVIFGALGEVRKNQGGALSGQEEQIRAFQQLGVSISELRSLNPDELFLKIADKLKSGNISSQQYAAALKVMGENAKLVLPAMERDLAAITKGFEDSGLAVTEGTTKALADLGNTWDTLKAKMSAGSNGFFSNLAGGFVSLGKLGLATVADQLSGYDPTGTAGAFRDELLVQREMQLGNQAGEDAAVKAKQAKLDAQRAAREKQKAEDAERDSAREGRVLDLKQKFADLEFEGMSTVEKRAVLMERVTRAQATLNALAAEGGDNRESVLQQQIALKEAQAQLKNLNAAPVTSNDQLARIGGFNSSSSILSIQTDSLKQITANTAKTASAVDKLANPR